MESGRPHATVQSGRTVSQLDIARATDAFDLFLNAGTLKSILGYHRYICDLLHMRPNAINAFYPGLKHYITSWRAKAVWKKFDARLGHKCYGKGVVASGARVLVIGAGPCGLRTAIETQMLGAKVVVLEKRDRMSRNNVLHLWPFVIDDLRALGAKKFFGKFCAGAIDHISIRQLQCILLKVALLLGVEIHTEVSFEHLIEPTMENNCGWRAAVKPTDHPVRQYEFDVVIGADGKRNTLGGFRRKEFRGKLAIAITANFINKRTEEEARVEEISGVAFIFNQKFFKDLYAETQIDLENIVYYKDETHYFVMTAKKASLIEKGVIRMDMPDTARLLAPENVDRAALMQYAREAAEFSTGYQMLELEFAVNHYGQPDVAMFDFTSMYAAENASRVVERCGHKLLCILVGDSLLEPFWPTGSGCARGFLSSLDAAWMIRAWGQGGKVAPLDVIAERESIYRLLGQTTPENLQRDSKGYTIDPSTRYPNLNRQLLIGHQVTGLFDRDEYSAAQQPLDEIRDSVEPMSHKRRRIDEDELYVWLEEQVRECNISPPLLSSDLCESLRSGLVLAAVVHRYRPDLIDFKILSDQGDDRAGVAIHLLAKEFGVAAPFTSDELAALDFQKSALIAYLSQVHDVFRKEIPHINHPKLEEVKIQVKQTHIIPRKSRAKLNINVAKDEKWTTNTTKPSITMTTSQQAQSSYVKKVDNYPNTIVSKIKRNMAADVFKKNLMFRTPNIKTESVLDSKVLYLNIWSSEGSVVVVPRIADFVKCNSRIVSRRARSEQSLKTRGVTKTRCSKIGLRRAPLLHGRHCSAVVGQCHIGSRQFVDSECLAKALTYGAGLYSAAMTLPKELAKVAELQKRQHDIAGVGGGERIHDWICRSNFESDRRAAGGDPNRMLDVIREDCAITDISLHTNFTSVTQKGAAPRKMGNTRGPGNFRNALLLAGKQRGDDDTGIVTDEDVRDVTVIRKPGGDAGGIVKADDRGVIDLADLSARCRHDRCDGKEAIDMVKPRYINYAEARPAMHHRNFVGAASTAAAALASSTPTAHHHHARHVRQVVPLSSSNAIGGVGSAAAKCTSPTSTGVANRSRKRKTGGASAAGSSMLALSFLERQIVRNECDANRLERQSRRREQRRLQTKQFVKSMQMLQANCKGDEPGGPFEDYSLFVYRQTAPAFGERVRDLERKFTYIPDRANHRGSSHHHHAHKGSAGAEKDGDLATRIQSIEDNKWVETSNVRDKKPKDLLRAIGKIETSDWNIKEIEKKIRENKAGKSSSSRDREKVPKWSREQFLARQTKMEKRHLNRMDSAEGKYSEIDKNIKILDQRIKEGTVREQNTHKVAQIAEKLKPKNAAAETPITKVTTKQAVALPTYAPADSCHFCSKRVYLMEKQTAENLCFHRNCFRCEYCNCLLRLGSYSYDRDGRYGFKFFCTHHFGLSKANNKSSRATPARSPIISPVDLPMAPYSGVTGLDLLDKVQTPERVEFSNLSVISVSSDHDEPLSVMDEDEWTDRNFGASTAEIGSSDDEDSYSDSESEEEYEEALEEPATKEGNMRILERYTRFSQKRHSDSEADYSSSTDHSSYCENSSGDEDSDTATEGEEEIRAREIRKQEVRVKQPIISDTGTDTEVTPTIVNADLPIDTSSPQKTLHPNDISEEIDNLSSNDDDEEYDSASSSFSLDKVFNELELPKHVDKPVSADVEVIEKPKKSFLPVRKPKVKTELNVSPTSEPLLIIKRTPSKVALPKELNKPKVSICTFLPHASKYFPAKPIVKPDKIVSPKPIRRQTLPELTPPIAVIPVATEENKVPTKEESPPKVVQYNFEPADSDVDDYIENLIQNESELLKPIEFKAPTPKMPERDVHFDSRTSSIDNLIEALEAETLMTSTDGNMYLDESNDKMADLLSWMNNLEYEIPDRKVIRPNENKYKDLEITLKSPDAAGGSVINKLPQNNIEYFENSLFGKQPKEINNNQEFTPYILARSKTDGHVKNKRTSVDLDAVSKVDIKKVLEKFESFEVETPPSPPPRHNKVTNKKFGIQKSTTVSNTNYISKQNGANRAGQPIIKTVLIDQPMLIPPIRNSAENSNCESPPPSTYVCKVQVLPGRKQVPILSTIEPQQQQKLPSPKMAKREKECSIQ